MAKNIVVKDYNSFLSYAVDKKGVLIALFSYRLFPITKWEKFSTSKFEEF